MLFALWGLRPDNHVLTQPCSMLIKLDMTVLEHDLIQSQVVMLLENKLMVYLFIGGSEISSPMI